MRRRRFWTVVAVGFGLAMAMVPGLGNAADPSSPIGSWRTIDDKTNTARAVVQIYEQGNLFYGRVTNILDHRYTDALCQHCSGYAENKPVMGLVIMQGMRADGDHWGDGTILNPQNGKVYRCRMHLGEGGRTLVVRGYIGTPMIGRTQVWQRLPQG